ncbi:putative orfan [Tupanvirus soda lake]|uniref:Orfan n=2 Tax=Tupanvirus TaxID=2094720 RepID=A0AC62AAH8_9VIRU|nr:putative orfan [Tupanvirus soda lake]QKU34792.1 putative orfan [Tupanvirus soda lake]
MYYCIYFSVCNKYEPEQIHISTNLLESFKYMAGHLKITSGEMITKFCNSSYDIDKQTSWTSTEKIMYLEENLEDSNVITSCLPIKYYYEITKKDKDSDKRCTHKNFTVFILRTAKNGDTQEACNEMKRLIL